MVGKLLKQGGQSNLFRLPQQNTTNGVAYKWQKCVSRSSWYRKKMEIKAQVHWRLVRTHFQELSQPSSLLLGGRHRALSREPGELIPCGLSLRDVDKYLREARPREVSAARKIPHCSFLNWSLVPILCFDFCFRMWRTIFCKLVEINNTWSSTTGEPQTMETNRKAELIATGFSPGDEKNGILWYLDGSLRKRYPHYFWVLTVN